ncbi:MAG TPA: AAA family ATPase [Chthonomonadaceae bacterium]|nr:AAA family ATPase [Chthonomonadaceae bacterium]
MTASIINKELELLIRARYPIIYIVSWEEKRVEDALREIAQERGKKIFVWTATQGMSLNANNRDSATRDPLAALDFVMDSRDQALFVLKDFHPFINDVTVTRRLRDLTLALKTSYKTMVIIAPSLKLPGELEKEVTVVDYSLPDREDLDTLLEKIIQSVKDNPQINTSLTEIERDQILKAAQGLTANEAENVFAKSIVEKHRFDVDVILGEKEQIIRKSGILEYYPFSENIGDVGGLDLLKDWMEKRTVSFTEKARAFGLPEPRGVLLLGVQGCGKCFQKDTPILMFNGEVKAVQDVRMGDLVMGPDSLPRRVLSTTRGQGEMFRITPTKGNPYTVNADHILTLRMSGKHKAYKLANAYGIVNIPLRDYLGQSACFKQRAMGYRTRVDFPAVAVPLDPYFLGVWLGDGSDKVPAETTADEVIVGHVAKTAASYGLNVRRVEKARANRAATYFVTAGNQGRSFNPVLILLRDLGVLGNKHIPLLYRVNSREVRLRLLAGIIDTDGCMWGNDYEVIQKRKQLAEDIAFVARSLGLAAYICPCQKSCTVRGIRFIGNYYRIHISGDTDMIPVRLHHKQAHPRQQRKNVLNTGIRVESVGPGDYYGFAIDGDHRFLLGDFTVVHNSLSAKAIGSLWRLPLLRLDVGRIFAGIVGSSEENMRKAIRVAESVAPCILWADELEKGFSGTQSSGVSDGGTTARVFATFLTWMQDKKAPVFVVATSNDVTSLPPELLRKGRFDEIFFIDLPAAAERKQIFAIHISKRKRDPEQFDLEALAEASPGFSGAEIEAAVVDALYDAFDSDTDLTTESVLAAIHHTVPLSVTMQERIEDLRVWAATRARATSSDKPEDMAEILARLLVSKSVTPPAAPRSISDGKSAASAALPPGLAPPPTAPARETS